MSAKAAGRRTRRPLVLLMPALTLALLSTSGAAPLAARFDWTQAEKIIIEKSARRLTLIRKDSSRRTWPIALGADPVGSKIERGDKRTPEGRYVIDYKNLNSRYYLSVRISYPNERDRARAASLGVDPGGNIMIHGLPNDARPPFDRYLRQDWTEGCIAVSNQAMQEIWLAVRENTPVEIRP